VLLPDEAPWLTAFIDEVRSFPSAKYDDQVDSMANFLLRDLQFARLIRTAAGSGRCVPGIQLDQVLSRPEPRGSLLSVLAGYGKDDYDLSRTAAFPRHRRCPGNGESFLKFFVLLSGHAAKSDNIDDEVRRGSPSNELAEPLDRPTTRRILVQGQVRSQVVVIAVSRKDSAQMALPKTTT
jgi:hypothetical protein